MHVRKGKKFSAFGGKFLIWGYEKGESGRICSIINKQRFRGKASRENKVCRGGVNKGIHVYVGKL